jgi:hypothetical protein
MNDIEKAISDDLEEIRPGAPEQEISINIGRVIRNINKLYLLSAKKNVTLLKVAADLKSLFDSQLAFNKMEGRKAPVEKFDESFFRSLDILKKDLFTLLAASDR